MFVNDELILLILSINEAVESQVKLAEFQVIVAASQIKPIFILVRLANEVVGLLVFISAILLVISRDNY